MNVPTVVLPRGKALTRIRSADWPAGPGHEEAPFMFYLDAGDAVGLKTIAFWKWDDAGRPSGMKIVVDSFTVAENTPVVAFSETWGFANFEAAIAQIDPAYRPSMTHVPGQTPIGNDLAVAAWVAARSGPPFGWSLPVSAGSLVGEVMLVRGVTEYVESAEISLDELFAE